MHSTDKQPLGTTLIAAPLWRRLFAILYDTFLLFGISMVFGFIYVLCKKNLLAVDNFDDSSTGGGDPLMLLLWLCIIIGFFCWFWMRIGQTLGMQSWRVKIVQGNGLPPSAQQSMIRLLIAPLSMAFLGLGYWWCLFGQKRTWQDHVSRTQTIIIDNP